MGKKSAMRRSRAVSRFWLTHRLDDGAVGNHRPPLYRTPVVLLDGAPNHPTSDRIWQIPAKLGSPRSAVRT
jgi:hypothetical protein